MDRKRGDGIGENQGIERFSASLGNVALKDQIDLMARNWFSLTAGRTEPIEHSYLDAKTGVTETVLITGTASHGIATIFDQDLLLFAISQWVEANRLGLNPTRRIHFTPYQFFSWLGIGAFGSAYDRLNDSLQRLKKTSIQTTIRSATGKRRRGDIHEFSWISEWRIQEDEGEVRGIEMVLAEWLFESIRNFHVLTLDKRYFEIRGSVERWLYLYARKATGGAHGIWKESFKSLHLKSASQQDYRHFASTLRKLIKKDNLPGLRIEKVSSLKGKDMLRMERTEKRALPAEGAAIPTPPAQLALIERTPLEETWENVLEVMRRSLGADISKSWLEKLQLTGLENDVVVYRAPSKFIADWVETHYRLKLEKAWQGIDPSVQRVRIELKAKKAP